MSRIQRAFRQLPQSSENVETLLAHIYNTSSRSDGSSEGHGRSAWGYALQRGGTTFQKNQETLHGVVAFDAELLGATIALQAALSNRRNEEGKIFCWINQQQLGLSRLAHLLQVSV